ncbi:MAG TPA: urease accessory UreF family protein [Ilumatobacteraceae bacterium]
MIAQEVPAQDATAPNAASLALLLQLADSSFPSGGFTISWGLEGMVATGEVAGEAGVGGFVTEQLHRRWASFDRVVAHLVAAALASNDPGTRVAEVLELDELVEAMSLPPLQREASRAAGRTFLASAATVVGGELDAMRQSLDAAHAARHLTIVHPLVFLLVGARLGDAELISGMQLIQQLATAALRLGVIGHLGAQRVIAAGRVELETIVAAPPVDLRPAQFVPWAEMAMYRQPMLATRMFRC